MCDSLDGIALTVRPVIHWVDTPFVSSAVMSGVNNTIHHRVTQVYIGGRHINLGPQRASAIKKFTRPHTLEQIQILLGRTVAVWTILARFGQSATILSNFVCAQVANIRFALFDQLYSILVKLLKVIRGIEQPVIPIKS